MKIVLRRLLEPRSHGKKARTSPKKPSKRLKTIIYLNIIKYLIKKQKNKKTGQTRVINKEIDDESFFNFFKSLNAADLAKKEEDEDVRYH